MAQLRPDTPNRVYRGTAEEVFSHWNEIPLSATVELKVFANAPDGDGLGAFGGRSVLDLFPDLIGTEHGGPSDMSERPSKYLSGFGETRKPRQLS